MNHASSHFNFNGTDFSFSSKGMSTFYYYTWIFQIHTCKRWSYLLNGRRQNILLLKMNVDKTAYPSADKYYWVVTPILLLTTLFNFELCYLAEIFSFTM